MFKGLAWSALVLLLVSACSSAAPPASPTALESRSRPVPAQASAPTTSPAAAAKPQGTPIACCSTGGNGVPNNKPYDSTFFENGGTNPFVDTLDDHLSTFGMDVDTASFSIAKRFLADGHLPEPDSVRVEEFLNSFDYRYPVENERDFQIYVEGGPSPYNARNELVQVGIQARQVPSEQRKPAALTFVIDTSGSMDIQNRLQNVKRSLRLLVDQMRPDDSIAIVSFGSTARTVLGPTRGSDKQRLIGAIDGLRTDGATSIDAGLGEGFRNAEAAFNNNGINMVLLCTDGVANNGVTDAEGLLNKYRAPLGKGIQLSVFGFGMGNYNDVILEKLANKGNGSYAYLDSVEQARRVFVQNLTGTLQTIGRDAKIQVDFNPDVVSRYRLLGYENRDVADNDFRNDKVDGGEVGSGQSVTALYEITRKPGTSGNIGTVHIRYQSVDRKQALEQERPITNDVVRTEVSERLQLAGTVAQFAEVLKHSFWARGISLTDLNGRANAQLGRANDPQVRELLSLMQRAASLQPQGQGR